ncbi:uncharacterized protein LOC123879303 [Maniola jurtina]|uniref:uncharacterized protein LOC123879303 n=1 Tax=Maniola jurtina TaxID=191418 RepID=UPI001E68A5A2|nr:uncharacterized protein LOC123879303 [Maniola jurtina]
MSSKWKIIQIISTGCCLYAMINQCCSERKFYISLERPVIDFTDPKSVTNLVVKSKRLSRSDPVHYLTINLTTMVTFDKQFMVYFAFYELLSNVYKRSFVEWHNNGCEFLENDILLGSALRAVYYKYNKDKGPLKCPMPPGNYSFPNMFISLSALLDKFPFQQGRVFVNVSRVRSVEERAFCGHIDFQIKSFRADRYGANNN